MYFTEAKPFVEYELIRELSCVWDCVLCHALNVFVYAKVASNDDKESQILYIYLNGNASYRNSRQSILCSVPFHSVLFCECIIHSYVNQCRNPKSLCKLTNFNFRNVVCTTEYLKSRLVHIWRTLLPRGFFPLFETKRVKFISGSLYVLKTHQ